MGQQIGLFGGTFDPVHFGHLLLAESAREQLQLDQVVWIPAAVSPFKRGRQAASSEQRLKMLDLAVNDHPHFRVSTIEIDRGGISYTIDTLRILAEQSPSSRWFLLMGADSLQGFPQWREPGEILQLATLAVVRRPGSPEIDWDVLADVAPPAAIKACAAAVVDMPLIDLSSTEIRQRVAEGRSIRYRTPRSVERFIAEHRLYSAEP